MEERWKLDNSPALQRSWMDRPSSGLPGVSDLCGRDGTVVRLFAILFGTITHANTHSNMHSLTGSHSA